MRGESPFIIPYIILNQKKKTPNAYFPAIPHPSIQFQTYEKYRSLEGDHTEIDKETLQKRFMTATMAEREDKKAVKKVSKKLTAVDELTTEEREAVTIVFHQFETGLREGTIFTKVSISLRLD